MSNDKTLATVKHGGCVQLGDSLTRFRCAGYDPTDGSGPIMVADREGPWVLAADVLSTSRNGNAAPEEAETSASKDDWFGDVLGSIGTVIPLGAALSAQPQYITDAYELGMRDGQNLSAQPSPGGQGDVREQFETHWLSLNPSHTVNRIPASAHLAGEYGSRETQYAWELWKAALAAPPAQAVDLGAVRDAVQGITLGFDGDLPYIKGIAAALALIDRQAVGNG
ncbi:TPA: hypothetical protein R4K21_001398 [Stenotrophomonas maltophilia]|nr:hypothetical protein [Stenotrophomonas maltophilia]